MQSKKKSMIRQASALIPTSWGNFQMSAYSDSAIDPMPIVLFAHPEIDVDTPVYVRIHSECFTGDIFGSLRCDCGEQLHKSMEIIQKEKGALIYLRQEGRGIGLIPKLKAYNLQDNGWDTADANTHLGYHVDNRSYSSAIEILVKIGIKRIKLITNNPNKLAYFDHSPIEVVERIPIIIESSTFNIQYLKTKKEKMGHLL